RIGSIDRHCYQGMRRRGTLAFGQGLGAPYELTLVPGDPAVQPGHSGGIGLGKFSRPDSEALLKSKRVERNESVLAHPKVATRIEQDAAQSRVLGGAAVDLVAKLTGHG